MVKKYEAIHECPEKYFYFPTNNSLDYIFCKNCGIFFTKYSYKKKLNKTKNLNKFHLDIEKKIKSKNFKNKIKIDKFLLNNFIKQINSKPKNLLDFGCGYGSMLFAADCLNINAVGYDINHYLLNFLKKQFLIIKKKSQLKKKRNYFDCVIVNKVLNLSPNIEEDFYILNKVLKKKGYIILIDQVKDFSRYENFLTKKNNNTYLLTKNSIKYFADKYGFKIISIKNLFGDVKCILQKTNKKKVKIYKQGENFSPPMYQFFEKNKFIFNLIYNSIFLIKSILKKIYVN